MAGSDDYNGFVFSVKSERILMVRQSALLGHGCAAGANIIWGLMAPIAKVVMIGVFT